MIALVHIVMVCVGAFTEDQPNKFHDYESMPGWIIIALRVMFYVIFMLFAVKTYVSLAINNTEKKEFLLRFMILGSMYLLALPVLVGISSTFVAPYIRNKVIVIGTLTF